MLLRVQKKRQEQPHSQNVSVFLPSTLLLRMELCYYAWVRNPAIPPNSANLVVFGEFYLDLVFYGLPSVPRMGEEVKTKKFAVSPGGGLATTSLVAAGLGTPTSVITRIGRDALESPAWTQIDARLPTALTVCASCGGDRMMITYDVINRKLEQLLRRRQVQTKIRAASHIHLACALQPTDKWKPELRRMRKLGVTLSADIGWNPEFLQSPQLRSLLRGLEFTFPNELEAKTITGTKTAEAAARELSRWVRIPVVKLGKDGSVAVKNGRLLRVKPLRVKAMDATGSGDAFNGGFLHGYLAGWSLEECMRAGNVCGALATTQAGGSSAAPTQAKLKTLMAKLD
jgi:sugar/nucleoside kinase (ribokinase family)